MNQKEYNKALKAKSCTIKEYIADFFDCVEGSEKLDYKTKLNIIDDVFSNDSLWDLISDEIVEALNIEAENYIK